MKNTFFRKNVSTIKDTVRKWNKELVLFPFLKKVDQEDGVENQKALYSKTLHVILLILGNVVVIALFLFLYILL